MQRTVDTALSPVSSPKLTQSKSASVARFNGSLTRKNTTASEDGAAGSITKRKQSNAASPPKVSESALGRSRATASKFVVPDSDKVFNFKCSGELGGDSMIAGKRVEWKAKFDRPIEELLYPSLQRFDISGYEKKVAQAALKKQQDKDDSSKTTTPTPNRIRLFNIHEPEPIRLEPIPRHLLPASEEIMFVHAPQWNVKVTDSLRPRTAENGGSVVKFASLAEEIEIEGERFLRQQMKASIIEKEEERKRREKLAQGFMAGLSYRRMGVDVQPGDLAPLDKANLLVS